MYTTQNNRQRGERQLDSEEEEKDTDRQIYVTQNNRQIERQLDRVVKKVAIYTTQNNRQREIVR